MHVLVPDLHKHRAALGQQVPRHRQPVAQIAQIRMNAVPPRVAERLHLFRLPCDVLRLPVLNVAAGGGPLEVGVEAYAVRRIDVYALHLAAQPLALGEAAHDLERVAQDHAIRPVGVMLIVFCPLRAFRQTVEIGEEIRRVLRGVVAPARRFPQQVIDQSLGVNLLLGVEGRGLNDQVGFVLLVLAAPDQLWVEVAVAALVDEADRSLVLVRHQWLTLGRRVVGPSRPFVRQGFDLPGVLRGLSHHAATRRRSLRSRSSRDSSDETMSPPTSDSLARSALGISV